MVLLGKLRGWGEGCGVVGVVGRRGVGKNIHARVASVARGLLGRALDRT